MSNIRENMNDDFEMDDAAVQNAMNDIRPILPHGQPAQVPAQPISSYKKLPPKSYDDWNYLMRRTMQEIVPGLFLGPYAAASKNKLSDLKAAGITHIICVRHIVERSVIRTVHENHFKYLVIEMADDSTVSLIPHCHRAHAFIDEGFASGGKVLVHGNAGMSRSAALVVAYVMSNYGAPLKEALQYVQSKRFSANPNEWFMCQLKEYEPIYQALHDAPVPLPGLDGGRRSLKREWPQDGETNEG